MVQFLQKMTANMTRLFQPPHSNKTIKKAIIATSVVATLSIGSVYAANDKDKDVDTVYHIYSEGNLLGTVSDKTVINDVLKKKIKEAENTYSELDFSIDGQITYVPERVYTPLYDNKEAIKNVNSSFNVLADAEGIAVDGKAVAFVSNKEEADRVIKRLKMKYVPEKVLTELENGSKEVKYDDFVYIDVHLEENVTSAAEKVVPEDILSVDKAVELLVKGTLQPKKHVVKEGEVLGQIANDNGLTLAQFLKLNPNLNEEATIHIGDEVNIQSYEPLVHVAVEKNAVRNEVIPFETEVIEDKTVFKGTTNVKQEGVNGEKVVRYSIIEKNGSIAKKVVVDEAIVKEPKKKIMIKGTKVIPSRGTGTLTWPTNGGYISSPMGYRWGRQHKGIDIARPSDYTIKAADNGKVESAGYDGGYGNKIVINHGNGMKTVYGHLSKIEVKVGQTVSQGQKIGVMGSTGNSTGTHLHFEVYENGKLVNPRKQL
ncbi:metalloendopeptidase-like membrane protein [Schinkia azotoformans MEV2011]|uniref:Metalloendopeptidase-like membrane protein n=1 Tax=Schinkia azotoformans MEV2011 TaxID=1348973 RepID=A0A072NXT1_SCHAZ|nr:M23 family metallopeptidase [Schinkia azotoformans]KEF38040.1 metalloendopeptidase-like membrane protein [Schinkia azotoformans MEV2011]MEC1695792.1 peptidoglycan DD-metalloendopeptidase family protein [Schinkia azotoformans]MEC1717244.1 peptidoglycan DD-metalloendopeptidase family protein [Schinkia azotoformans]MEC1725097.1 peptidoglycan DD-metalloendopeptidase family protein [Schinkia azotoformans]MEC1742746.1 peptidoglycan DD-metalloendopeptidase family protein [Schinkia azotoformans]